MQLFLHSVSGASPLGQLALTTFDGHAVPSFGSDARPPARQWRRAAAGTPLQWWSDAPPGPMRGGAAIDVTVDLHGTAEATPGRTWRIVDAAGNSLLQAFHALQACHRQPYFASIYLVEREAVGLPWQLLREAHLSSAVGYRSLLGALTRAAMLLLRAAVRQQGDPLRGPWPDWVPVPGSPAGRLPLVRAKLANAAAWLGARVGGDTYGIAVLDRAPSSFLTDATISTSDWIQIPETEGFIADPFFWPGRPDVMLCEVYSHRSGLGRLAAFPLATDPGRSREGNLLPVDHHLSYPFSWSDGSRVYCLPEMAGARQQVLYELREGQPLLPVCVIAEHVAMADPTIMAVNGLLWLSYTDESIGGYDNLCLMFADRPEGPWQPHPCNPVKIDVRSSRPGGTPFRSGGRLYRPAQDCARTYGAALAINEVTICTPEHYEERTVAKLLPDPHGVYPDGLHTLSIGDNGAAIDGKRISYHPTIIVQKLRRALLRRLSNKKSS